MDIKKSIYDSLDKFIVDKILYEYVQSPKQNYDNLVKYLKSVFSGSCSSNCRLRHFSVYGGRICYHMQLVRQTQASCVNCNYCVSDYSHDYCIYCCRFGSAEYLYHHSRCIV